MDEFIQYEHASTLDHRPHSQTQCVLRLSVCVFMQGWIASPVAATGLAALFSRNRGVRFQSTESTCLMERSILLHRRFRMSKVGIVLDANTRTEVHNNAFLHSDLNSYAACIAAQSARGTVSTSCDVQIRLYRPEIGITLLPNTATLSDA